MQLAESSREPWEIQVFRGKNIESTHNVSVSIVDENSQSVFFSGDVDQPIYPRSAIKFLQAIPFVESGAYEAFNLKPQQLALSCASHHAESFHLEMLKDWLSKADLKIENLVCGPQIPVNKLTAEKLLKQGEAPTRLMNNCSGKHLGMLTTALHKKEPTAGYHSLAHPVQMRVMQVLREMTDFDIQKDQWGIDGCCIPNFVAPLKAWATAMATLLNPQNRGMPETRKKACEKIIQAVTEYPEFVSGTESFDYKLQRITGKKVILKSGAEGVCCGLIAEKGFAFALKVLDGNQRAVPAAVLEILKNHAELPADMQSKLESELNTSVKNTCDEVVGQIQIRKYH